MFYIKSEVITIKSIEMYGFVTAWTSMDDGPYWVILLMYKSHDMRHTGFRRLTVVNGTPKIGASQGQFTRNEVWDLVPRPKDANVSKTI